MTGTVSGLLPSVPAPSLASRKQGGLSGTRDQRNYFSRFPSSSENTQKVSAEGEKKKTPNIKTPKPIMFSTVSTLEQTAKELLFIPTAPSAARLCLQSLGRRKRLKVQLMLGWQQQPPLQGIPAGPAFAPFPRRLTCALDNAPASPLPCN